MRVSLLALALLASPAAVAQEPVGTWYAQLVPIQGREVGFEVRIEKKGSALSAVLVNGASRSPFTKTTWDGTTLTLDLAHFDAKVVATRTGDELSGTYSRMTAKGVVELPFAASKRKPALPKLDANAPKLDGDWAVEVGGGTSLEKKSAIFRQVGASVTGTMRTDTGDDGPLHGTWDGKALLLTVFDGVHVYRFDAEIQPDGSLAGDFRSRTNPPVPWIARRIAKQAAASVLRDGFGIVKPKDAAKPYVFAYPDPDGKVVSSTDPAFAGKPMVITFMGTWCPNCNDEAPVLKELFGRYRKRGLQIVSLAFEYTDDLERSKRQVKRFKERYATPYTVLIAGTTTSPSEAKDQLAGWEGYPTTLFLDRSHRIVKIHSGFDGPATGEHFVKLKREMEETVESLLR